MPDIGEVVGYILPLLSFFTMLGKKKDEDPVKEIKDPKEFLVKSAARLACTSPGVNHGLVKKLDLVITSPLLKINLDSAKGYKSRGIARSMLGRWEEAPRIFT
ncbi:hypothetical protein IFM89_014091 [Coptis chinensis]|uniref:Uncharacterized protein n=1 Tax=Coptis chinensis TaxID=261450 RepID=A0A835GWE0_9MAGN|nr:hypothetical protein IFM89_014091 [Coptis chinensis]